MPVLTPMPLEAGVVNVVAVQRAQQLATTNAPREGHGIQAGLPLIVRVRLAGVARSSTSGERVDAVIKVQAFPANAPRRLALWRAEGIDVVHLRSRFRLDGSD